MSEIQFRRVSLLVFVLLGSAYAWVVPIGEAPDEPAHLAYVDHVVGERALPQAEPAAGPLAYESYQPPLDYLVSAGLLAVVHGRPVEYPFVANPGLDFHQAGSRAFLPKPDAASRAWAIRKLRLARLFWGMLTVLFVCQTVRLLTSGTEWAVCAAAPFVFCPQFLFNSATVNNDTAVTALSSAALLGLCHLVSRRKSPGTGTAAGLALWSKASGLFLALPLLVVSAVLLRQSRGRAAAGLVLPFSALAAGWVAFTRTRSSPLVTGLDAATAAAPGLDRLIAEPTWPLSVWVSFWGKFGWLNLRLPGPVYLLFLPPTVLVLRGAFLAVRGARSPQETAALRVLLVAFAANVALLVAYLVGGGWQLQGRYLFPSLAALAGLAVAGLADLGPRLRVFPWLWTLLYAGVGALGVWWIERSY
jgi:hypothetical protein